MTASAGAWYRVGTVNVTNGQQSIVGVNTAWQNDVISIAVGDIFTLDAKTWYEVTAVNSDTSLTLDRGFEGATQNTANYAIVRNTSGTLLTRIAGQIAVQFNQKQLFLDELRTWLNSDNAAEELTDSHGVKTQLKTPAQMVRDHDEKLAELDTIHPHPWAIRKAEFEAMRAANNEKYAASGFVYVGKHFSSGSASPINEGLYTWTSEPNQLLMGRGTHQPLGKSKTGYPVLNIAGVITNIYQLGYPNSEQYQAAKIKLPPAEDGTRTYDSATGVPVANATPALAFAAETEANKVVTDRVDGWGFLQIEQELNDDYPFVYAKGLPQSLASEINGVATITNNIQPIEYFAWYEGDTTSRGKGVNWLTATEAQRMAIASDPENKIYFSDETGRFYQTHVFGLSWRGAGNGDWQNVDAIAGDLQYDSYSKVSHALFGITKFTAGKEKGVFTADNNPNCHILFCGTLERMNKGAYHQSFNPLGAARWRDARSGSSVLNDSANWNEIISPDCRPTEKSQAFNFQPTGVTPQPCASNTSGFMGSPSGSGRPDGRHYDAIYESGQGGVCRDMRYPASGLTAEDFAEEDLKIKSGEYRGREILLKTSIIQGQLTATGSSRNIYITDSNLGALVTTGTKFYVVSSDGTVQSSRVGTIGVTGFISDDTLNNLETVTHVIVSRYEKLSISGEFIHTEVIGKPAEILLCDDLKDGWVGSWNPTIPDGQFDLFELSKPYAGAGSDVKRTYTVNNGAAWVSSSVFLSHPSTNETEFSNMPANQVTIYQYKTKAKATQNATNSKVYGGKKGVGNVLLSQGWRDWTSRDLGYSLTGKILTSIGSGTSKFFQSLELETYTLYEGKLGAWTSTDRGSSTHVLPVNFNAPEYGGPAFKALNYNVAVNQQALINYAYAELHYDTTAGDWGDDGKIHIADNQTTMTDENGHTVLVGTARCIEPLGWLKNDK